MQTRRTKLDELNPRFAERVKYFLDQKQNAEALVLLRWGSLVESAILPNANAFGEQPWQMTQSEPSKCPKRGEEMGEVHSVGAKVDLTKIFDEKYDEIVDLTMEDEYMEPIEQKIAVKIEQN